MRIGELARRAGTTPRTVRYYEEIGLLGEAGRPPGAHRAYDEHDLERLTEVLRLKALLGLSLDELRAVVEAEEARAALRREWDATDDLETRRRIAARAIEHLDAQLALVRRRRGELAELEEDLTARRARAAAILEKETA